MLKPITGDSQSDTAVFDNVLELLLESGRGLPHALRMLIPEAWNKDKLMDAKRRAFYDYFSTIIEPWDGPALIAATDGYRVAAILDRNGLRPCRYCLTRSNIVIMASETGVLDTPANEIVFQSRLKPGEMFLADTLEKRIVPEQEIFEELTTHDFSAWLAENRVRLKDIVKPGAEVEEVGDVTPYQRASGYTLESLRCLVQPMAEEGKDPIGSMGNDTPLAILSTRHKPLFQYFLQLFAQVSNPPLDYLREDLVTSLESHIGRQRNLLEETPEHCRQLFLESPILTYRELETIKHFDRFRSCVDRRNLRKGDFARRSDHRASQERGRCHQAWVRDLDRFRSEYRPGSRRGAESVGRRRFASSSDSSRTCAPVRPWFWRQPSLVRCIIFAL